MGRRIAAPRIDGRPLVLQLAIMLLGIAVLTAGAVVTVALVVTFFSSGIHLLEADGDWDVSPGGAILGMTSASALVAFGGWAIFRNGRFGPRPAPDRAQRPADPGNDWD